MQEEARRREEHVRREEERRRTDEERRRVEVAVRVRDEARKEERRNSQQPVSRRSVGKLIARRPNGSLNTSKIRIEDEENTQPNIQSSNKGGEGKGENRKSEELISSIKAMRYKITGEESGSLH